MRRRRLSQWMAAIVSNSYLSGWLEGRIYQGKLKMICVPFLNCYSCPGALGSCPVGAFQSLAAGFGRTLSLYIGGLLLAIGALGGRVVCGWLCPFGLVQELVHRGKRVRRRLPKALEKVKFVVLGLTVALPFVWRDGVGLAEPYFCKYLCPAGTLQGGLPLVAMNPGLQSLVGWLFSWKLLVLILIMVAAYFYWRPFCRVLCPLGAFYGLLNPLSIWQLRLRGERCIDCGACTRQCKAALDPTKLPNNSACVRCLECVKACPTGALTFTNKKPTNRAFSGRVLKY
ncbi:MAG: 4Fe-4S binding protein [Firmicutes bacterium]|nr:4Fe-4S binding protein [Bacillota bacterium]